MAKPNVKPKLETVKEPVCIGESLCYKIRKFGLYRYQCYSVDLITGKETPMDIENIFNVVASNLIDRFFNDINPDQNPSKK